MSGLWSGSGYMHMLTSSRSWNTENRQMWMICAFPTGKGTGYGWRRVPDRSCSLGRSRSRAGAACPVSPAYRRTRKNLFHQTYSTEDLNLPQTPADFRSPLQALWGVPWGSVENALRRGCWAELCTTAALPLPQPTRQPAASAALMHQVWTALVYLKIPEQGCQTPVFPENLCEEEKLVIDYV